MPPPLLDVILFVTTYIVHTLPWCRKSLIAPAHGCRQCSGCGVLRPLAWYTLIKAKESGRVSNCRLCKALVERLRRERYQRELEGQDPITEKRCTGCGNMLPAASFNKNACRKDNYHCQCNACSRPQKLANYLKYADRLRNQTLVIADGTRRVCSKCSIHKPRTEFHRQATQIYGIQSVCKRCYSDNGRMARLKAKIGI